MEETEERSKNRQMELEKELDEKTREFEERLND